MPWVVSLLVLGEGITGKVREETGQTDRDRQNDSCCMLAPITPLICFFEALSQRQHINSIPYPQIQTGVEGCCTAALKMKLVNPVYDPWKIQLEALLCMRNPMTAAGRRKSCG